MGNLDYTKYLLKEICTFKRGQVITAKDAVDGDIPVIAGGMTPSYYHDKWNRDGETIVVAGSGAYAGYVSYWERPVFLSDSFSVEPNTCLSRKYLYHYLKLNQKKIYSLQKGAGIPHVHGSELGRLSILVPNKNVQKKIVEILDSFTNLIVALNEELALRQKQFVYYREKLLTFDEKYNKTLGSIGVFTKGNGLQKSDFVDNGYPCIHYGQIHTKYYLYTTSTISFCTHDMASKLKKAKTGDLLIASTSENVDDCCKAIAWLGDTDVAYSGDSYCFSHNEDPMYISYLFQSNKFSNQKKKFATGAKVVRVSGDSMAKIEVPIPPLEIQHSIAEKLDAFESLISSLKDEIVLRQKQYEYYREKLLTFD